ncbi:hypothetical protein RCL_jg28793.t1 [Rhizophagus clarus]|uniref:Uncharacterized protein n=1 Tax=Rhizophagus clarus TaxID=94130 RepID=A0A8H3QUA2_9GLOM|nr:hypothetical protein RCL_jg28793.t1 [Rhizophagus clarus]
MFFKYSVKNQIYSVYEKYSTREDCMKEINSDYSSDYFLTIYVTKMRTKELDEGTHYSSDYFLTIYVTKMRTKEFNLSSEIKY